MPIARVTGWLSNYPHITQSFEFDFSLQDALDWGTIEDAAHDWAHEEIGKRMMFKWKVEVIDE